MAMSLKERLAISQVKVKRLVVESEGIHAIVGLHDSDLPVAMVLPTNEEMTEFVEVGLIKVRSRYALYKPIAAPIKGRFNDTFDPAQV
jgi:hypothetical protein